MIPSKKKKVHQRVHHCTLSTTKTDINENSISHVAVPGPAARWVRRRFRRTPFIEQIHPQLVRILRGLQTRQPIGKIAFDGLAPVVTTPTTGRIQTPFQVFVQTH